MYRQIQPFCGYRVRTSVTGSRHLADADVTSKCLAFCFGRRMRTCEGLPSCWTKCSLVSFPLCPAALETFHALTHPPINISPHESKLAFKETCVFTILVGSLWGGCEEVIFHVQGRGGYFHTPLAEALWRGALMAAYVPTLMPNTAAGSGFPFRWKSWVQSRAMVTTAQRTPRKQCLQVCTKNRWRDPEGSQRQHRKTGTNTRTVWRLCWCNFLPLVSRCMGARWVPHSGGRSATPLKGRGKLFKVFRWLLEPCWKVRSICARTRYAKRCEKLVNNGCSALYSGVLTQSHAALFQVRGSISDTVIVSKTLWQAEFSAICSMSNCWLKILKPFCKTQLAGFLPPVFPSHISKRRTHVYLTAGNPSHASVAIAAKHESTTAWAQSGKGRTYLPLQHDPPIIGATHTKKYTGHTAVQDLVPSKCFHSMVLISTTNTFASPAWQNRDCEHLIALIPQPYTRNSETGGNHRDTYGTNNCWLLDRKQMPILQPLCTRRTLGK